MNEEFIKELLKNASSVQVIESDADIDLEEAARAVAYHVYLLFNALMNEGFKRDEALMLVSLLLPNEN